MAPHREGTQNGAYLVQCCTGALVARRRRRATSAPVLPWQPPTVCEQRGCQEPRFRDAPPPTARPSSGALWRTLPTPRPRPSGLQDPRGSTAVPSTSTRGAPRPAQQGTQRADSPCRQFSSGALGPRVPGRNRSRPTDAGTLGDRNPLESWVVPPRRYGVASTCQSTATQLYSALFRAPRRARLSTDGRLVTRGRFCAASDAGRVTTTGQTRCPQCAGRAYVRGPPAPVGHGWWRSTLENSCLTPSALRQTL